MGSYIGDLNIVKADVKHVLSHIDKWAKPESPGFSLVWAATRPKIYKEPKGVVLIVRVGRLDRLTVQVGPFNYPINLLLVPLIGAIAGGNAAVLKPSEQVRLQFGAALIIPDARVLGPLDEAAPSVPRH